MKVGIFLDSFCEKNLPVESLRKEFLAKGNEVIFFIPQNKTKANISADAIRVKVLKFPGMNDFPLLGKIKKSFESSNFDIIHLFSFSAFSQIGGKFANKNNLPFVITCQTLVEKNKNLVKKLANSADHLSVPSEPLKIILEKEYKITTPISVIPMGFKLNRANQMKLSKIHKRYLISSDKKILFFEGEISKKNNLDLLFKSFISLRKKFPRVHLIINGSGPDCKYYSSIIDKLNLLDKITLLDLPEKDSFELFSAADLFVSPSNENLNTLSILKALSSFTPVVALKNDEVTNIIINGRNGYLAENNSQDFSEKIYKILKNSKLLEQMSKVARKKSEDYDLEKTATRFLDFYRLAIRQHETK